MHRIVASHLLWTVLPTAVGAMLTRLYQILYAMLTIVLPPRVPSPALITACLSALLLGLGHPTAKADTTSSAFSASSTSLGSASTSLGKSSDSSTSSARDRVAQGIYTVTQIAEVTNQPDHLQIHLQASNNTPLKRQPFVLMLPRATADRERLGAGDWVQVAHRPYGLAFSRAVEANEGVASSPFFLVLDDDWHRELGSQALRS